MHNLDRQITLDIVVDSTIPICISHPKYRYALRKLQLEMSEAMGSSIPEGYELEKTEDSHYIIRGKSGIAGHLDIDYHEHGIRFVIDTVLDSVVLFAASYSSEDIKARYEAYIREHEEISERRREEMNKMPLIKDAIAQEPVLMYFEKVFMYFNMKHPTQCIKIFEGQDNIGWLKFQGFKDYEIDLGRKKLEAIIGEKYMKLNRLLNI